MTEKSMHWFYIEQLISAGTAVLILSSDWLVSLKLCSDWLSEPLTDEFQKWRQTDRHTHTQTK